MVLSSFAPQGQEMVAQGSALGQRARMGTSPEGAQEQGCLPCGTPVKKCNCPGVYPELAEGFTPSIVEGPMQHNVASLSGVLSGADSKCNILQHFFSKTYIPKGALALGHWRPAAGHGAAISAYMLPPLSQNVSKCHTVSRKLIWCQHSAVLCTGNRELDSSRRLRRSFFIIHNS